MGSGAKGNRQGLRLGVFCLTLMAMACNDDSATFRLTTVTKSGCATNQFPFEPTLFSASPTPTGVFIRMAANNKATTEADTFFLNLIEGPLVGQSAECPKISTLAGTSAALGPTGCIQAYFRFLESCRDDFVNPLVVGTVTFESLGLEEDDVIKGTLTGQLVDFTTGEPGGIPASSEVPLADLEGEFDFTVKIGPSYQTFGTPP